ncbi:sugar ABC transporter substrate-binding protein [Seohaeicola zhoushanensis]|uniref:ABC transporter substrate-binding protein n=1 Tax=Seohaeicola zhoushanensis TaxID=1569283 RepID=A0A8J3H0B9_9RHOB|nr:sugar ABC transporter substrate-binding protein [Seohaeicola zhoushanensis]GHF67324.1 ABC transporter substrate-binding protein [Seohaeicola zhoushanensis]
MLKNIKNLLVATVVMGLCCTSLAAEEWDDGQIKDTRELLKGKRVGFVPLSMGIDLGQVWLAAMERDAKRFGYEIVVRESSWNVQNGAQAINQLIGEKVDLLVIHPAEVQAWAKLVNKAEQSGVPVVQVNMKSPNTGDAYVGANWYDSARLMVEQIHKMCAPENGGNGKIAIVQGVLTSPANYIVRKSMDDFWTEYPGLEIVADQPADYDSTKAKAVASTVLKQHPDLCGFLGMWEVMDMGVAAAVKEADLQGKVHIVSSGGGEKKSSCDNIANGNFDAVVSYEAEDVGYALASVVTSLLQNPPKELGKNPIGVYTPSVAITKNNYQDSMCWDLESVKRNGF